MRLIVLTFICIAFLTGCKSPSPNKSSEAAGTYIESGGLVIMECENTDTTDIGMWQRVLPSDSRYVSGATNNEHLEFTDNKISSGPPNSPITYTFYISKPGTYQLYIRARKRLEGAREDLCNDCYVRMAGDFISGNPKAELSALLTDTKLYGGNADDWGWATNLDSEEADHTPAKYVFKAGETYTLTVSGRSQRFNIDRLILHHIDITRDWDLFINSPESKRFQ